MATHVETKDCTSLSDGELAELGDICTDGPARLDIGLLSKQREEWVLVTLARHNDVVEGFSFCTLERIGGTPSVLIGLASIKRSAHRHDVLRGLMGDQLRRAVLAFPDEDVLIGTRLIDPAGFEAFTAFTELHDIVPRPGHKATGEERAWGRRLAKRFGIDGDYHDRQFVSRGDGVPPCVLDHESLDPETIEAEVRALFDDVDASRGDCLVAFGWAMAEDLAAMD
ncbi:MAG: hypothetical protein ACR2K0_08550 [Acidimicrobiales bacterium]|jgi:hypothetical protein